MKSRTSFFNKTIFRHTVSQYWPVWAIYLGIWFLILPVAISSTFNNRYMDPAYIAYNVTDHIFSAGLYGGLIMGAIFAVFCAFAAWNFMYNSRSTSGYASLPVRRESMFVSVSLGAFVPVFVCNILIALITWGYAALNGCQVMEAVLNWFGAVNLQFVFFYGFAVFCAQLTGNIVVLPLVYGVLNFVVVAVEALVRAVMTYFVFGYEMSNPVLGALSPIYHIADNCYVKTYYPEGAVQEIANCIYYIEGFSIFWWYALAGIVFAVIALLIYRRRRMEAATDVVALKPLKPVFKYCMTFGCALVLGVFMFAITGAQNIAGSGAEMLAMMLFMMIGGIIGYIAAAMLNKKSFRIGKGQLGGLGISIVIIAAFVCACEFDIFGIESRVPEVSEIESVDLYSYDAQNLTEEESIELVRDLHSLILENKASLEERNGNYIRYSVSLNYRLKNGNNLRRYYTVYAETREERDSAYDALGVGEALDKVVNCPEAVENRISLELPVTTDTVEGGTVNYWKSYEDMGLDAESAKQWAEYNGTTGEYTELHLTAEDVVELYNECILPDIAESSMGRYWVVEGEKFDNTVTTARIHFSVREYDNKTGKELIYDSFSINVTTDAKRTMQWLSDHGVTVYTEGQRAKLESAFYEGIDSMKFGVMPEVTEVTTGGVIIKD